jgi:16S rRNA A1518/A1519 N6-dimethyltransferase RsmA/KsgA/DIM1 with predicted DNA glycosylase/AP lyase activity
MSFRSYILSHLDRASRLLEIGAGSGRLAGHLMQAGHEVIAIDPDALVMNAQPRTAG